MWDALQRGRLVPKPRAALRQAQRRLADTSLFMAAVAEMPPEGPRSPVDAVEESVRPGQTAGAPGVTAATIMEAKPREWDGLEQDRRQTRLSKVRSGVEHQEEASVMPVSLPGLAG